MVLSEYPDAQELKEVIQQHPDPEITRQDSLNAGNSDTGTDEFLDEYFGKIAFLAQANRRWASFRLVQTRIERMPSRILWNGI